jgi:hypothetical protein
MSDADGACPRCGLTRAAGGARGIQRATMMLLGVLALAVVLFLAYWIWRY